MSCHVVALSLNREWNVLLKLNCWHISFVDMYHNQAVALPSRVPYIAQVALFGVTVWNHQDFTHFLAWVFWSGNPDDSFKTSSGWPVDFSEPSFLNQKRKKIDSTRRVMSAKTDTCDFSVGKIKIFFTRDVSIWFFSFLFTTCAEIKNTEPLPLSFQCFCDANKLK